MSGSQPDRHALVTGGGSGVGRAVALKLADAGWYVAIAGRTAAPLEQTARLARIGNIRTEVCDVADLQAVHALRDRLDEQWGALDVLVAAAGINVVRRGWFDVSPTDVKAMIDINLIGTFNVIQAFLPLMRRRANATIVTLVSDAGLIASAKAGTGYVASKFGLAGLTESLNVELRDQGIRATAIFPGDIDTPMLDMRPAPPSKEQRTKMLQADDVADCVMLAINLPPRAVLEKLVVRPR
jgi:NAD(P)-dependent dehydrogenase (short-subunit alcohol dehydrogenase family)